MKFTLSWLKDFLETEASLNDICIKLTQLGLEVESFTDPALNLQDFIVAEIKDTIPHPNADKLQICTVFDGKQDLQIVCGARNARKGIKVVLAPIGAIIPNGKFKIRASKIRDVESNGMLCSAEELLLNDASDGIIELDSLAKVGEKFVDFSSLCDPMIELSITPNRGDCLGVHGIARDLAAAGLGTLKPLANVNKFSGDSAIKLAAISEQCLGFIGAHIKNITNGETPPHIKTRLNLIGCNSISKLVDISNYFMYSFNRPVHIYDAAKLSGMVTARRALDKEKFLALNGNEYELTDQDLVIADDKKIIALAGIIGSADSGCDLTTKEIFVEIANFDSVQIAKTGRRLKIDSESRYRFERELDHNFAESSASLIIKMITEFCGGEVVGINKSGVAKKPLRTVEFSQEFFTKLAGINLPSSYIQSVLTQLGFTRNSQKDITITIPSWRNDIAIAEDIVEEILRVYGYNNVEMDYIPKRIPIKNSSDLKRKTCQKSRKMLSSYGYNEVVTWSFMSDKIARYFTKTQNDLFLTNPISSDLNYMRPSIAPNLLEACAKNDARGYHDLAFFEIGPVFENSTPADGQKTHISAIKIGKNLPKNIHEPARKYDIFDIKADMLAILELFCLDCNKLSYVKEAPNYYHPGKSGSVRLGKQVLGYFGEVHPSIVKLFDLQMEPVLFEVVVDALPIARNKSTQKSLPDYSDYQIIERDFAFLINKDQQVNDVLKSIRNADKELIKEVSLFDIYSGDKIAADQKSIAINVKIQSKEKTLDEAEINILYDKIIENVTKNTSAVFRTM